MTYTISTAMRTIAKQLNTDDDFIVHLKKDDQASFELSALNSWLKTKAEVHKKKAIIEYLLIQACLQAIAEKQKMKFDAYQAKKVSATDKIKWFILLLAGTALVGSDAAGTVLGWVGSTSISVAILVAVAITYAAIAIAMFYAFELYAISCHLGISFRSARHIVDRYLHELQQIEHFIESIEKKSIDKNTKVSDDDQSVVDILMLRLSALKQAQEKLEETAGSKKVLIAKGVLTVTGVLIYAAAGFFSGNAAASSIAAIFMATAVPFVFWPTLLAGAVIALCAIIVYFHTQKPTIEQFVENSLGLEFEKLQTIKDTILECENRIEKIKIQEPKINLSELELDYKKLAEENGLLRQKLLKHEKFLNFEGDTESLNEGCFLSKEENDYGSRTFPRATSLNNVDLSVGQHSFLNQNADQTDSIENVFDIEEQMKKN